MSNGYAPRPGQQRHHAQAEHREERRRHADARTRRRAQINYTGTTTVNSGILAHDTTLSQANAWRSAVTVNAGGEFRTSGTQANQGLAGGTITLNGGILSHTTTAANAWKVWSGVLTIGAAGGTVNVNNTNTTNNNVFFDAGIAGTGALTLNTTGGGNNGIVFRTGAGSYSGALQANSGNVFVNGAAGLVFQNSDVTLGSGATLRLDANWAGSVANASVKSLSGTGNVTLGAQTLTLGTNNGTGAHSGVISGTGRLIKTGTGTQTLAGTNTYTGITTVDAGTLQLGNGGATGNLGSGAVTLTGGATLAFNRNNSYTVGNVISGAGTLAQIGSGTTTLTATNTYTGATTVAAGTLRVNGSLAASPVTANAGSTLGGSGTIGGPVTIATGATLDAGPAAGAVGTLTTGALTLNAGSQLNYDLGQPNVVGGPNNDLLQVNGNLTLGGVVNVNAAGSIFANTLLPGSYRLINYTGTLSGSTTIGSIPSGFAASQIQTAVPSQVNLIAVQNGVPTQFWDGADTTGNGTINGGTASWNNSTSNWTNAAGGINQSWIPGVGIFTGTAGIVTIAEPVSAMGLQFITDGYQVTSAGSALTMVDLPDGSAPFIRVDPGATVNISAADRRHAGPDQGRHRHLTLSGANTFSGGVNVTAGTLSVNGNTAPGGRQQRRHDGGRHHTDRELRHQLASSRVVTLTGGTVTLSGSRVGSARFTGAGGATVSGAINLSNNANDYTGQTQFGGAAGTYSFSSIADLGVASALGAPTTVANGTIFLNHTSGAPTLNYTGSGDSSNRNWSLVASPAPLFACATRAAAR